MWLPPAPDLVNPALNRSSLFVVQAWRELLDPRSPDTYRAKAMHPFLLLAELRKVCDLAESDPKWLSHVHLICAEIREEAEGFSRLAALAAATHAFTVLGTFANVKPDDLHRVKETVLVVSDLSGDPLPLMLGVASALLANNIHEKAEFLQVLGFLATHAYHLGVRDEIDAALDQCDLTQPPETILGIIAARLGPKAQTFHCFLAISGEIADIDSLLAGSAFSRIGLPRIDRHKHGQDWHATHAARYLAGIEITASSCRLAADRALSKMETMLNLLALYANRVDHHISSEILVDDGNDLRLIDVSPAKHYGLFPRKAHIKTTRDRIQAMGSRLDGRVSNILGAHALGISDTDPRAALSHFWTSLEAIVGSKGAGGIGERVANAIAPIVASRRTHKIANYLALSIYATSKSVGKKVDFSLMPSSTKGHVSREDVLSCLTGPNKNAGILSLFGVCAENPLLCYHIMQEWKGLSEPREAAKALKRSEQRVKWQLLRIYRARNIFVHKGGNDELVWRLLENAQSYISFVLGRVMSDMSLPGEWSIDTAIEFERHHFDRICTAMERMGKECSLRTTDLLPHLSSKGADVELWGAKSRFGV